MIIPTRERVSEMGCRKNIVRLTVAERQAFTNAVNELRASGRYQAYVEQHRGAMGHGHLGPAFFPWHREYLRRFEEELQDIDPSVSVPYWDWTRDNLNASGTESFLWRADLMGGPGAPGTGAVTDGPFASWGIVRDPFSIFDFPGTGGDIAGAMSSPNYTTFRSVESPHGAAHVWVGGFMSNASIAPRDPVFWLLHANVDRLWSEWIQRHASTPGFQPFLPLSGGRPGHNLNDTMWPWNGTSEPFSVSPWNVAPENVRPADFLDHRALDYFYDTIDPECRPVSKLRFKELKDRLPKELKEQFPKELKDRMPKELIKDRQPKELIKDRLPKEMMKDISPKEIREVPDIPVIPGGDPFIRPGLRPDLSGAAVSFEPDLNPDIAALQEELLRRQSGLGGGA